MKRNKREHGRILSVETKNRGDSLAEDFAAGVTSITVNDAGDFDEDGGWLSIGAQVIEFTACDDDTGVITLVDPLTAAAEQGDPVAVYDPLYGEVVDYQLALVELDGEYDNPDPVTAEVAEGVSDLPEGDRGEAGESCVLKRVGEDEWEVVGVGGRPRKSRSVRWEQDDTYMLTAADVAAGSMTMPLAHRPADEALTCVLASVPQPPTEWSIGYDAQTLTIPLDGWEKAGDVAWVHYAYRKGLARASKIVSRDSTSFHDVPVTAPPTVAGAVVLLAIALRTGKTHTALNGWTFLGESGSITHAGAGGTTQTYRLALYTITATGDTVAVPTFTSTASGEDCPWVMVSTRGASSINSSTLGTVADAPSAGTPALSGTGLRVWAIIGNNQHISAPGSVIAEDNPPANPGDLTSVCIVISADESSAAATVGDTAGWMTASVAVTYG